MNNKLSQPEHLRSPCGKSVYIRNLKCASSYYAKTLEENHWQIIAHDEVDWNNDLVWSTIMDPYVRYCKGLAEDLRVFNLDPKIWETMPDNFWQEIAWSGVHSMPISYIFGDRSFSVNWIPIDLSLDHRMLTDKLLEPLGIKIKWLDYRVNVSDLKKKQMFEMIKNKAHGHIKSDFLHNRFLDYRIYHMAVARISELHVNKELS